MSFYFALLTIDSNKNMKVFQGDMLIFCDFIQVFVFTTNHHLKLDFESDNIVMPVMPGISIYRSLKI